MVPIAVAECVKSSTCQARAVENAQFPTMEMVCRIAEILSTFSCTLLYLATNFPQQLTHFWIAQNGRLRKIPADIPHSEGYLLCLKVQGNLSDLLTISLQPFFSPLSAM
jgi:hypothetical protein